MSDPVNPANEPAPLAEAQPSPGFDVNAAAAGVRAELEPAAPALAGPWSAADYGWDPSDANAVAWAAYYSEQGIDPAALAAQQAAEAAVAEPAADAPAGEAAPDDAPLAPEAAPALALDLAAELEPELTAVTEPAAATAPPRAAAEPSLALDLELGEAQPAPVQASPFTFDDAPLDDLAFGPVSAGDEPGPGAVPVDLAPGVVDGGSAIWELLPADPAPAAATEPEAPRGSPAIWSGDERGRLEDFQLASGGSFDEPTAPIGDLAAAPESDATDALDDLSRALPALDLEAPGGDAPAAALPPAASAARDPLPLPALDLSAPAPEPELAIDLGFVEDEPPAPAPAAAAAPPAGPLPFELDLETPEAAPAAAAPAVQQEPELELDLSWAEHAVPLGDDGVDLASFDAAPQSDRPPDGTAMWGLPARPAPAAPASGAPRGDLLGDAAPLPTPQAAPPDLGDLGEPLDGSLFLEPVQDPAGEPAGAPAPDPWDVAAPPAPPLDLVPESGAGPFDLGAPEEPPPVAQGEAILEVGEEVVEISAGEPAPPAPAVAAVAFEPLDPAPASAVAAVASPPPAPAAPQTLAAPLVGAELFEPSAEEPPAAPPPPAPAAAAPSCFIAGSHRVVVHTSDGQVKRGTLRDAALDGPQLELLSQPGGASEPLPAERVKAIFFMLATGEPPPAPEGKKVRVTFRDGRQVAGFSPDYAPERVGFFMVPSDTRTHTARIWVYRASVRQVTVSP